MAKIEQQKKETFYGFPQRHFNVKKILFNEAKFFYCFIIISRKKILNLSYLTEFFSYNKDTLHDINELIAININAKATMINIISPNLIFFGLLDLKNAIVCCFNINKKGRRCII
ncbi:MAG: hypothetical protein LBL74_01810 [Bacteroidales bacterium]|jgi:hypothetical protein|nr:hypothetical protein [Bacteroidales bacterium]